MPAFDAQRALQSGYTAGEIADFLAQQHGFDIVAARGAGYSDDELVTHLSRPSEAEIDTIAAQHGEIKADERSFFGGITEPIQRGIAKAKSGITTLASEAGLYGQDDQVELNVRRAQQNREAGRYPVPENIAAGLEEIGTAKTMGEAAGAIVRNPRAVLEVALESIGASAPALVGAAAGSFAGPAGTATGAGLGSFAVEYASTINDVIAEHGGDSSDPYTISKAYSDPALLSAAREKAVKRGIPIAAFDALTAGVAGKLLAGAEKTVGSIAARSAGELGVQAAGGAAGEAVAQAVTGEYRPGDILLEAAAEMPSALTEVPGNYRHARRQLDEKALLDAMRQTDSVDDIIATAEEASGTLALPNIAGEPLVVFPDGSTMTRAEAQQRYTAEEIARLDAMVQDAPLPGMMDRAQERAAESQIEQQAFAADRQDFTDLLQQEAADLGQRRGIIQQAQQQAQRNAGFDAAETQRQAQIDAEREQLRRDALAQQADLAPTLTEAQGFDSAEPTAMQLAMQRATQRRNQTAVKQGDANASQSRVVTQQPTIQTAEPPAGVAAGRQGLQTAETSQAITLQQNATGNLLLTGSAEHVRAIEPQIRAEFKAQGIPLAKIADHDEGVSLRLPKGADEAKARAIVERINGASPNGGIPAVQANAAMAAPRVEETSRELPGSGGVLAPDADGQRAGTGDRAEVAASGVRPAAPVGTAGAESVAPAADLAGDQINREWTAFADDSGSLGVPRAEMPQIKAEHRGAMTNFMNARGVQHQQEEVAADSLKPTQAEFSPAKVKKAIGFDGGDRSILVSSDNYVLDGHHQWLAKREAGEPIKVIRLDAPIRELIGLANEFPSSQNGKGATPPVDKPAALQAPKQTEAAPIKAPDLVDVKSVDGRAVRVLRSELNSPRALLRVHDATGQPMQNQDGNALLVKREQLTQPAALVEADAKAKIGDLFAQPAAEPDRVAAPRREPVEAALPPPGSEEWDMPYSARVWDEESGKFIREDVPAGEALKSVDEDISALEQFIACMKG